MDRLLSPAMSIVKYMRGPAGRIATETDDNEKAEMSAVDLVIEELPEYPNVHIDGDDFGGHALFVRPLEYIDGRKHRLGDIDVLKTHPELYVARDIDYCVTSHLMRGRIVTYDADWGCFKISIRYVEDCDEEYLETLKFYNEPNFQPVQVQNLVYVGFNLLGLATYGFDQININWGACPRDNVLRECAREYRSEYPRVQQFIDETLNMAKNQYVKE